MGRDKIIIKITRTNLDTLKLNLFTVNIHGNETKHKTGFTIFNGLFQ
jgi:hypothetical protein